MDIFRLISTIFQRLRVNFMVLTRRNGFVNGMHKFKGLNRVMFSSLNFTFSSHLNALLIAAPWSLHSSASKIASLQTEQINRIFTQNYCIKLEITVIK